MDASGWTVRHDFLRILFATMLLRIPYGMIRGFWKDLGPELPGFPATECELYRFLWKKTAHLPAKSLFRVFDSLEPFCQRCGLETRALLDGMLWQAPVGTFIPGNTILPWLTPVLPTVFHEWDPRVSVLKFLHIYTGNYFKGHIRHMVRSQCRNGNIRFHSVYITDKTFQDPILFDCHLIAGSFLRNSPKMFGLPAFDEIGILSDCRPAESILDAGAELKTVGARVFLDGVGVGKVESFSAFLARLGLDLGGYGIPDRDIVHITREYRCPRRGRTVLFPGCAYGAPLYLQTVDFRKLETGPLPDSEEDLKEMQAMALSEWKRAESLYEGFLETTRPLASFTYYIREESIELNGDFLARSVPAKILRFILSEHLRDGRKRFLHQEFKRNPDITYNPSNPNFELRLRRVAEKLTEKMPSIRIVKADRGAFLLERECRLEYQEQ
jgi:hypothetical protein